MNVLEKLMKLRKEATNYAICACSAFQHCEDCPYRKYEAECKDFMETDYLMQKGVTVKEADCCE